MNTNNAKNTTSKVIPIPIPAFAPEERPPVGLGSFASGKLVSVAAMVVVSVGRVTVLDEGEIGSSAVEVSTTVEVTPSEPVAITDVKTVNGCAD
jgi:hypothetical protein